MKPSIKSGHNRTEAQNSTKIAVVLSYTVIAVYE